MASAGYSGTPLAKKLGIKPDMRVLLVQPPPDYAELLGVDISAQTVSEPPADLAHIFAVSRKELRDVFMKLIKKMPSAGIIWISWYKKSSKIPTDITEDLIREIVLPTGWVDVKVCAVSDTWSGLKIVKRVAQR